MTVQLSEVEKETATHALRHYLLQCEQWRNAAEIAFTADIPAGIAAGKWALEIERLTVVLKKIIACSDEQHSDPIRIKKMEVDGNERLLLYLSNNKLS